MRKGPDSRHRTSTAALLALLTVAAAGRPARAEGPPQRAVQDVTHTPFVDQLRRKIADERIPLQAHRRLSPAAAPVPGAPISEVHRNYLYLEDQSGQVPVPMPGAGGGGNLDQQTVLKWIEFVWENFYDRFPDEFVTLYMFTAFDTNMGVFFYAPLSNDIQGIGQDKYHLIPQGGPQALDGFVFMNYWKFFPEFLGATGLSATEIQSFSQSVFNQETAHRWVVTLNAHANPKLSDGVLQKLLGRQGAHWSYFMQSFASPMEGNQWKDNGNGSFTTQTTTENWHYNTIDLYLMGLLPSSQVKDWFLIDDPIIPPGTRDIFNQTLTASSPPQITGAHGLNVTIRGTAKKYSVNDFISRLGARNPDSTKAPRKFRVAFAMVATKDFSLSKAQRLDFENMVDTYATAWSEGTGKRAVLDYALSTTSTSTPVSNQPIGGSCSTGADCDPNQATQCVTPVGGAPAFCSRSCSTQGSCPPNWCCAPDRTGAQVCTPALLCSNLPTPDAGVGVGADANNGAGQDAQDGGAINSADGSQSPTDSGPAAGNGDNKSGCSCAATGAAPGRFNGAAFALLVVGLGLRRFRRR